MTAIFSYVKVCVAVLLRELGGRHALLWCGVVTQLGSLLGAIITFLIINVFHMLHSMQPCPA